MGHFRYAPSVAPTVALRYTGELDVEYQSATARDARLRKLAIGLLGRQIHLPTVAHAHLLHSDNPTLYQVAQAASQRRTAAAAVKLLAVDGPTRVVRGDNAARRWMLAIVATLSYHLIVDATIKRQHAFFLSLCGQPFLICLYLFSFVHNLLFLRRAHAVPTVSLAFFHPAPQAGHR